MKSWTTAKGLRQHNKIWHGPYHCEFPGCPRKFPNGVASQEDLDAHWINEHGEGGGTDGGDDRERGSGGGGENNSDMVSNSSGTAANGNGMAMDTNSTTSDTAGTTSNTASLALNFASLSLSAGTTSNSIPVASDFASMSLATTAPKKKWVVKTEDYKTKSDIFDPRKCYRTPFVCS